MADDIEETLAYLLSERVIAPESAAKIRAAVAEHDALRDAVRGYLALHWTATAEMGAHDQTDASVDAAVAAEMAALETLRELVRP